MLLEVRSSRQVKKRQSPAHSHFPLEDIRTYSLNPSGCVPGPCWPVVRDRAPPACRCLCPSPGWQGHSPRQLHAATPCSRSQSGGWSSPRPLSSGRLGWCNPAERHGEVLRSHPPSPSSLLPGFSQTLLQLPHPQPLLRLHFSGPEDMMGWKGAPGPEKRTRSPQLPARGQGAKATHHCRSPLGRQTSGLWEPQPGGRRCRDNLAGGLVTPRSVAMVTWFFL